VNSATQFPLPSKQFRRYAIFWSLLMLGALVGALVLTLWRAYPDPNWRDIVVAVLLLVQMGSFALIVRKPLLPTTGRLVVYFCANLAIWAVQIHLVPVIWWTVFAYMGQMFGMLPVRFALPMNLFAAVIVIGQMMGWRLSDVDVNMVLAIVGQWTSVTIFMVYISHLSRTSIERGKLIAELEAAKNELEKAQQREMELAVLRERERLARDLHDSLGHALVAIAMQLEAIQRLYPVDPKRASSHVDEVKALARSSMGTLRDTVAGLRAPGLGNRPLSSALRDMCVELGQRAGIDVDCRVDSGADDLSPALTETTWRIAQEALTNVEKHAQAHQAQVSVACCPGALVMRIADDGIGLSEGAEARPDRFGLRGMRERIEGLGGTMSLESADPGTVITAQLPLIGEPRLRPAANGLPSTEG